MGNAKFRKKYEKLVPVLSIWKKNLKSLLEKVLHEQKFKKSSRYGIFKNWWPQPPNSSQILKPIRKLVTTFFQIFLKYTSFFCQYIKKLGKSKDTFDPHPPTQPPTRTIKVFEISKKSDPRWCFWTPNFTSPMTYNIERLSSGPN